MDTLAWMIWYRKPKDVFTEMLRDVDILATSYVTTWRDIPAQVEDAEGCGWPYERKHLACPGFQPALATAVVISGLDWDNENEMETTI